MSLLRPGETCWRTATAARAAFLIDADAYYTALRAAMLQAQRKIRIIGWDVDSRTRLGSSDTPSDGLPATLLPFLNALLAQRRDLEIDVLAWDFAMIYAFEREALPQVRFGWQGHKRLRFVLDGVHPVGASHHQKLVVIDDRVAFTGGIDLTIRRWDTTEHGSGDERRVDPKGVPYHPMHDVGIAVDGELAATLAELARARWLTATGSTPDDGLVRTADAHDPWPRSLAPDVRSARFGIARTLGPMPTTSAEPPAEIREIERLTIAAIESARETIVIENQYLTASCVGVALARRLEEPDGPEVVVIVPHVESGWLERGSMGVLRTRLLAKLSRSDRHRRLRVLHPIVPGANGPVAVGVHSKVLFVDDRFCKVGSANMSNRSMALDTECDLALDAADGNDHRAVSRSIVDLRARLLAEHLGRRPAEVIEQHAGKGSLVAAIEALSDGDRRLEPLREVPEAPVDLALLDGLVCDPEKPLAPEALVDALVPGEFKRPTWRALRVWTVIVVALLAVGAVWHIPGIRQLASLDQLAAWGRSIQRSPGGLWLSLLAYVAAAIAFAPITLLITATALVLDPWRAFGVAYVGAIAAACGSYAIGRLIGARALRRFLSPRMLKFRSHIRRGGFLAITAARLLPVGNFAVINVVAGALVVPFGGFVAGNVVGLLPGTLLLSLLADRLSSAVAHPTASNVLLFVAVAVVAVLLIAWVRRVLRGSGTAARVLRTGRQES